MILKLQIFDKMVEQPVDVEINGDIIKLNQQSIAVAERVGHLRNEEANRLGRPPAHGYDQSDDLGIDRQGAYSELAVAALTGKKWNAVLATINPNLPDVGDDIQVKSTHYPNGRLIAHQDSLDTDRYVLVIWKPNEPSIVKLAGWVFGREAKQQKYWQTFTGRPCFMVPQSDLRPTKDL